MTRRDHDPDDFRRTQILPPKSEWLPDSAVKDPEPPPPMTAAAQLLKSLKHYFGAKKSDREARASEALAAIAAELNRHGLRIAAITARMRGEK